MSIITEILLWLGGWFLWLYVAQQSLSKFHPAVNLRHGSVIAATLFFDLVIVRNWKMFRHWAVQPRDFHEMIDRLVVFAAYPTFALGTIALGSRSQIDKSTGFYALLTLVTALLIHVRAFSYQTGEPKRKDRVSLEGLQEGRFYQMHASNGNLDIFLIEILYDKLDEPVLVLRPSYGREEMQAKAWLWGLCPSPSGYWAQHRYIAEMPE